MESTKCSRSSVLMWMILALCVLSGCRDRESEPTDLDQLAPESLLKDAELDPNQNEDEPTVSEAPEGQAAGTPSPATSTPVPQPQGTDDASQGPAPPSP